MLGIYTYVLQLPVELGVGLWGVAYVSVLRKACEMYSCRALFAGRLRNWSLGMMHESEMLGGG